MAPHFCLDSGNIDDLVNLATEYLALHIPTEAHSLTSGDYYLASGRKLNQQLHIASRNRLTPIFKRPVPLNSPIGTALEPARICRLLIYLTDKLATRCVSGRLEARITAKQARHRFPYLPLS